MLMRAKNKYAIIEIHNSLDDMNKNISLSRQESETKERIDFDVHANIIHDLIYSQNGTVATAIRELVMNAIDAGSKKCEIVVSRAGFSVRDWGKGFESEESIKTYFKNFGEPHQEGDAVFGRFRIGRGQIMAFGEVTWTSKFYAMHVDTRKNGFSFEFQKHEDIQWDGCRVDGKFYQSLSEIDVYAIKDDLKNFLSFCDIELIFNGDRLNIPLDSQQWDIEDDEVLIQWKKSNGMRIYSQGVFVKSLDAYYYGVEGIVVTKKALKLNMARNEISDTDPLWRKIAQHISDKAKEQASKSGKTSRVDTATRRSLIRLFKCGELDNNDVLDVSLLKDCRGHSISIRSMLHNILKLTVSPESGSRVAESIASRRLAQVLDHDVLDEFDVDSIHELIETIAVTLLTYYDVRRRIIAELESKDIVSFNEIASNLVDESLIHPKSDYTSREAAARNAIWHGSKLMARELSKISDANITARRILLGVSDVADGWTNGSDTIVIAKHMLKYLDTLSRSGGFQIAYLLLHEYLHTDNDSQSHHHDYQFMSAFHDITSNPRHDIIGMVAMGMYTYYLNQLSVKSLPLPKKIQREFNYPVVNELQKFTIYLKDKAPNSFLKKLFSMLDISYSRSGVNIVIYEPRHQSHNYSYRSTIFQLLKKHYDLKDIKFYHATIKEWDKAHQRYQNEIAKALTDYLKISDVNWCERVVDARDITQLLTVLSDSDSTGLCYTQHKYVGYNLNTFNAKVNYNHAINNGFEDRSWDNKNLHEHDDVKDYAQSETGRLNYAKQVIKHAFWGLNDTNERQMLADMLFSEKGKEHLAGLLS